MDGQNKKRLVDRNIVAPLGLAIDYPTQRLYWADVKTNKIETVKLDGSDRHLIRTFTTGKQVPFYSKVLNSSECLLKARGL